MRRIPVFNQSSKDNHVFCEMYFDIDNVKQKWLQNLDVNNDEIAQLGGPLYLTHKNAYILYRKNDNRHYCVDYHVAFTWLFLNKYDKDVPKEKIINSFHPEL